MDDFFSTPLFEKWLREAPPELKQWFKKEIEWLKESIPSNSRILDVGCGFGRHLKILANSSRKLFGIDNNKVMIKKARKNLAGIKNIRLSLQNGKELAFKDNSFDFVICMTNTFGNLPSIKLNVLKEMRRVCRKGGKVIVSVYSEKSLDLRVKSYKKVGVEILKIEEGVVYARGFISEQFSKEELENLFKKFFQGVRIVELTPFSYLCEAIKA